MDDTPGPATRPGTGVPDLEPGLTVLHTPEPRSSATHRLALGTLARADGRGYWLDARNTASTYALYDLAPDERALRGVRIARAFTAYQHVSLIERVVNAVSPRAGCVVAPNAASLYRDADVPAHEAEPLLEAGMGALAEVATTFGLPVLVTDAGPDDDLGAVLVEHATAEIRCERTAFGYRYEGDGFETTVYWQDGYWQTTIPYWVDILGAVADRRADRPVTGPALRFGVEG